ncbi:MAG: hypothetical protein ICV81_08795 [Flavisolibacter sp.]|nr:hypothetical protein [Flavisolibacter sp.]
MKSRFFLFIISAGLVLFSSCSIFKPKYGCGTNGGRNVGAEKILSGEQPKKVKKFKA